MFSGAEPFQEEWIQSQTLEKSCNYITAQIIVFIVTDQEKKWKQMRKVRKELKTKNL